MMTTITDPSDGSRLPQATAYRYDQLNRLLEERAFANINETQNKWNSSTGSYNNRYFNYFTYDGNGNIITQHRHNKTGEAIDSLAYKYYQNDDDETMQNRLYHVRDEVGDGVSADDIDDQGTFDNDPNDVKTNNNYSYTELGELEKDEQEQIASIVWRTDGKIKEIIRESTSSKKNLKFEYDPMGNRIAKHVLTSANVEESVTYYVRDAQGNIMSTYVKTAPGSILSYKVEERHLYGSSRLGIYGEQSEMIGATVSTTYFNHLLGKRSFEGVNHLGNVLTVFSDRKFPQNSGGDVSGFKAELFTSQDYYPFGMLMPGRNFTSENYRFGFNGKETDNQVKGTGAQYDYGFRIYDSRLGKFLSIDPLFQTYPFYTPYQFSGNNPILFIDVDGLERKIKSKAKNQWKCFNSWDIKNSIPRHNLSLDLWKKKPSHKLKPLEDSENSIEPEEKYTERENIQPLKVEGVGIIEIPNNDETLKNQVPNPTLVLPDDVGYTMTFENHEIPPGHHFNFNESIPFKGSSDAFADPEKMKEALSPLANFLNSNPQAQVFVVGNLSAADLPAGHGPEVLNARRHLNGDPNHTARAVMNARAQAIQNYLIENLGVNSTQIIFGPGNNRTDRATPTTTFQIRNRSNQ